MNIHCPHCLKQYSMPEGQTNILRVRCRGCGAEFLIKPSGDVSHELTGKTHSKTIIIADIQRTFRNQMVELLQRQGFNLIIVEDGRKAHETVLDRECSMLLVNPYLPGLMGFELIERLRREVRTPPFIILLGSIHNKKRYRRRPETLYGADDYLDEGAKDEAILRKLEYHLETPLSTNNHESGTDLDALRLARSVFADILVYSQEKLSGVNDSEDFFRVFSQEAAEAERFLNDGLPGAGAVLKDVVRQYLERR